MASSSPRHRLPASSRRTQTWRLAVGLAVGALLVSGCGSSASGGSTDAAARAAKPVAPPPPTRITRWPKSTRHDGSADLGVRLAAAPKAGSPHPRLSPHVAGHWTVHGQSEVFVPTSTLLPCSSYTLTVPKGTQAVGHAALRRSHARTLRVSCPSTRAAQNALARLGYLPYAVHGGRLSAHQPESRHDTARALFRPTGRLKRRYDDAPSLDRGALDPTTKGALMALQHRHGLTVDGLLGPATWRVLLADDAADRTAPHAYTWVTVSKASPESLTLHRGDRTVLTTPANTGAAGADTPTGSFPIFEHVPTSEMRGTNPDGSQYDDKDVPWVSYFHGGDAVHGFQRASYGSRQSNGCVELPISTAKRVYDYLAIGDLVIVSG